MGGSEILYESDYETMVPATSYKHRTTSSTEDKGQYINHRQYLTTRGADALENGYGAEGFYVN